MGAFEQKWRDMHCWMRDRLEVPNSWLNWLSLYFPCIAIQIIPTRAVWIIDDDVLHHAHDNLMHMLREAHLLGPTDVLFTADRSYDDMMGPPTYNSDSRAECLAWTRIMGPLRKLQELTYQNAVMIEATIASSVADGDDSMPHIEDEEIEEEEEIEVVPARRPRGKQQPLPKRMAAPEEDEEEDDEETQ